MRSYRAAVERKFSEEKAKKKSGGVLPPRRFVVGLYQ